MRPIFVRLLLTVLIAAALVAPWHSNAQEARMSSDPDFPDPEPYVPTEMPESIPMWGYLRTYVDTPGDESEIEHPIVPGYVKYGYDPVTNRIKIFEYGGDKRQLPTFAAGFADIFASCLPVLDQDGNFNTTPLPSTAQPLVDLAGFPIAIRWPQGNVRVGDVPLVSGAIGETAPDGSTAVDRAVITMTGVEQLVAEGVPLNLNTTAAQSLYFNDTPRRFILTKLVPRDSTEDLSAFAGLLSVGTNGSAYTNWVAGKLLHDLVDGDSATVLVPDGRIVILNNGDEHKMKLSSAYGSAATAKVDVFGYYVN